MPAPSCRSCCRSWPARAAPGRRGRWPMSAAHAARGIVAAAAVARQRPPVPGRAGARRGACARLRRLRQRARAAAPDVRGPHRAGPRHVRTRAVVPQAHGAHRRHGRRPHPSAAPPACTASRLRPCRPGGRLASPSPPASWPSSGLAAAFATAYHWSQPVYTTRSDTPPPRPPRACCTSPSCLRCPWARRRSCCVRPEHAWSKGRTRSGIFGVAPSGSTQADARELRTLAQRLHADTRVLWVEPLAAAAAPPAVQERGTRER